jgi:hypothetical protein
MIFNLISTFNVSFKVAKGFLSKQAIFIHILYFIIFSIIFIINSFFIQIDRNIFLSLNTI